MTQRYDSYGFGALSLDDAVRLVERRLGIDLQPRDSSFYADTYYLYRVDSDRRLELYRNLDAHGAPISRRFIDHAVLLDVGNLDDMDGIRRRLTEGHDEPVLLRSEELGGDEDEGSS